MAGSLSKPQSWCPLLEVEGPDNYGPAVLAWNPVHSLTTGAMTPPGHQIYYIHTPAQTILNAFNIITHPLCHAFNVIVHFGPAGLWGRQTACALTEPAHLN